MYGHNLDIYIGVKHFKRYSFYNDYKKEPITNYTNHSGWY